MADVAENLRAFLLTDAGISAAVGTNRIAQTHVPEEFAGTLIWFGRTGVAMNDCLDAAAGDNALSDAFDLECIAETQDAAQALVELVKGKLHAYRGTFGTQTVQGCFCEDHTDGYESRVIESDSGLFTAAVRVEVHPR